MKNIAHRFCPQCGAAIAAGSLQGLCPNCLALVAFGRDPSSEQTVIASTPGSPNLQPAADRTDARPLISSAVRYFGDYELLGEIARGGMGVVHQARQVKLNRTVAVKMILSGKFATEADVKRFHTEAEAAANLQHPNIVAIHEVGEHEGHHYFSMDYVEGKNLADYAKEIPLPPAKAAELLKTIAEAIHYAHQRGTLHRDLKPQNVLMDAHGQPRITDFGLAKRVEKESELTKTGAVMGSPSYMPPEQAAGKNDLVGPASDVYSIGAILYQLLAGRAPFVAETPLATLRKVMEEEPVAPSKLNPKVPPDLETICLKCLEKKPERRYSSARLLAEELERFLHHEPILAKPASPFRKAWSWSLRHPWIITAAASALILGLVGLAYYLWQRTAFSEWRLAHPNQNPPYNLGLLESSRALYSILIAALTLANLPWLDFVTRLRHGHPILRHHLAAYSVIGSLEVAFGIFLVLRWAEAKAWNFPTLYVWYGYPLTLVEAFAFSSFGMLVVWEAVRAYFRAVSGLACPELPKPDHGIRTHWKSSPLTLLREVATVTGMAEVKWKIGPITMRSETVVGGSFLIPFAGFWLIQQGWWWAPQVIYGTLVSLSINMLGATKGAARFFWLFNVVVLAGIAIAPDYRWERRPLSFECWMIGVAAGLLLVGCSSIRPRVESDDSVSPGAKGQSGLAFVSEQGFKRLSFEVLRYLAAFASFAMFFVLLVPAGTDSHDWFSVLLGVSSLPLAGWSLSLRSARPSSVIFFVLILLFGSWLIFASPYAISFTLPTNMP